jgi:hypothetical protein
MGLPRVQEEEVEQGHYLSALRETGAVKLHHPSSVTHGHSTRKAVSGKVFQRMDIALSLTPYAHRPESIAISNCVVRHRQTQFRDRRCRSCRSRLDRDIANRISTVFHCRQAQIHLPNPPVHIHSTKWPTHFDLPTVAVSHVVPRRSSLHSPAATCSANPHSPSPPDGARRCPDKPRRQEVPGLHCRR